MLKILHIIHQMTTILNRRSLSTACKRNLLTNFNFLNWRNPNMFDLFEVFVKQLFKTPNIIMFRRVETPNTNWHKPTRTRTLQYYPKYSLQTILAKASVSDRAVARTGRNRLKDYLPVLEIIDMLAKQK